MPHGLNRAGGAAVREHGVARATLERPAHGAAAGDRLHMTVFGAALGDAQVIPAVAVEQMRPLRPQPARATPEHAGRFEQSPRQWIDGRLADADAGDRLTGRVP